MTQQMHRTYSRGEACLDRKGDNNMFDVSLLLYNEDKQKHNVLMICTHSSTSAAVCLVQKRSHGEVFSQQ